MAEFIYSTTLRIDRPVFIDVKKLEEFDTIIGEEYARLHQINEQRLQADVEARTRAYSEVSSEEQLLVKKKEIEAELRSYSMYKYTDERSLTILLKGEKKVVVKDFKEALSHQALLDETPIGFKFNMKVGHVTCDVDLRSNGNLEISVSPEHSEESRELFAPLYRWGRSIVQPKWQRFWVTASGLQWLFWVFAVMIAVFIIPDRAMSGRQVYRAQASELLKDGITQEEQLRAIELLLLLEAGLVPQGTQDRVPAWFWFLLFGGLAICLALSFKPPSLIGVGAGQEKIKLWNVWMKALFIIVPGYLLGQIFVPYLLRTIGSP